MTVRPRLAALALCAWSANALAQTDPCLGISPVDTTSLRSVAIATGFVNRPLLLVTPPADNTRQLIVEQDGYIRLHKRGTATATWTTFLDLRTKVSTRGNEMGLLGLAFAPDYATSGYFFVNYTEVDAGNNAWTVVARYRVSANPDVADAASELRILRFSQPSDNHNGGYLTFGNDGFLYVFTGDGGGGGDSTGGTCGNGQNRNVLLGKALRLDVLGVDPASRAPDCGASGANYRIPSTNPLVGQSSVCEEIWAFGLRNPWRGSIDPATGDWYIADVGQNCWEEVNWVSAATASGRNYGWRQMEATKCYNPSSTSCTPPVDTTPCTPKCNDASMTRPVLEYGHTGGACSITGGFVYRGCRMPSLRGTYFYGDYCAGFVRSFRISGGVVTDQQDRTAQLDPQGLLPGSLSSFGQDAQKEIYIVDQGGSVRVIVPPFTAMEVSGKGAADMFLLQRTEWTWENLLSSAQVPVAEYRVYRNGQATGQYTCIFKSTTPRWTGGDTVKPSAGAALFYLVIGRNAAGDLTATGGPQRQLSPATCP